MGRCPVTCSCSATGRGRRRLSAAVTSEATCSADGDSVFFVLFSSLVSSQVSVRPRGARQPGDHHGDLLHQKGGCCQESRQREGRRRGDSLVLPASGRHSDGHGGSRRVHRHANQLQAFYSQNGASKLPNQQATPERYIFSPYLKLHVFLNEFILLK